MGLPTTAIERLTEEVAAVAPISGLSILAEQTPIESGWHVVTNTTTTPSTLIRIDYLPEATTDQIAAGDDVAETFDLTVDVRRPRLIFDIYKDVGHLTAQQKTAIWTDLNQDIPPRWAQDRGVNAADLHILWLFATQLGAIQTQSDKQICQQMLIAIYTVDNPLYLVHPPFAPSIDIPGDEPYTP